MTGFTDDFQRQADDVAKVLGQDSHDLAEAARSLADACGMAPEDALAGLAKALTDVRHVERLEVIGVAIRAPRWERLAIRVPIVRRRIRARWQDRARAQVEEVWGR